MLWYYVTTDLRLCECYQAMPLEVISEEDCLDTDADRENKYRLEVANIRHNAFATSASSDKIAFTFHSLKEIISQFK